MNWKFWQRPSVLCDSTRANFCGESAKFDKVLADHGIGKGVSDAEINHSGQDSSKLSINGKTIVKAAKSSSFKIKKRRDRVELTDGNGKTAVRHSADLVDIPAGFRWQDFSSDKKNNHDT